MFGLLVAIISASSNFDRTKAKVAVDDQINCGSLLVEFLKLHKLEDSLSSNAIANVEEASAKNQMINEDLDACVNYLTNLIVKMEEFKYMNEYEGGQDGSVEFLPARETRRVKAKNFWKKRAANRKFW